MGLFNKILHAGEGRKLKSLEQLAPEVGAFEAEMQARSDDELRALTARWKEQLANAGDYDAPELAGIPIGNPLPIVNGEAVKTFFDDHVCGLGHVYFSGHDHSRQWLDEPGALCGTDMIVSGAGASFTEIRDRGNVARYEDATKPGFLYVDIDGDTFTGTFYDSTGAVDYTYTFTRPL